jgi:hypothetical protein
MKDKIMNKLKTERLNDFKKILAYHLVTKIRYHFNSNYKLYYYAPKLWKQWRNRKIKYETKIYDLINKFNQTSLSAKQVQSIFGKDESNKKWIAYKTILESDDDIKIFNNGTIYENGQRYQIKNRYQLPYEYIKSIFENKELLEKVCDAGSEFYSDRQRRLIFTQINKQQKYHYKTKQEIAESLTDEEMIAAIIDDI